MKCVLLIYGDERRWEARSDEESQALYAEYGTLVRELIERERWVVGPELQRTSAARTVRVRNGKTLVTDGSFAETKEQLGGFFLLECQSLEEALEIAARIPTARMGSVEVRPIVEREGEIGRAAPRCRSAQPARRSRPDTVGSPGFGRGRTRSAVHCSGSLSGRKRRSRVPWRKRIPCHLS